MPSIELHARKTLTVVVTLEGLATSPLGCYGCSWNDTPFFDQIASGGITWDRWTSPCDQRNGLVRRWLADSKSVVSDLPGTQFVFDDPELSTLDWEHGFGLVTRVPSELGQPAQQIESTAFAKLIASALDQVTRDCELLWVHSACLRDVWDAPIEEAEDDEDFEPIEDDGVAEVAPPAERFRLPTSSDVPSLELSAGDDPDLLFSWMQRYAAQIRLMDEMLSIANDSLGKRRLRWVLAGTSGFSLGQNGWIGHRTGPLRSHDIRLPFLVSGQGPLRVPALTSADEFAGILAKLIEGESLVDPDRWCESDDEFDPAITTTSDRARHAVTTAKWFFVEDQNSDLLILKPDDVDDVNDVSRLEREAAERLRSVES